MLRPLLVRLAMAAALLVATGVAAGCGKPPIAATDYNQKCVADADCVIVFVGDPCSCKCEYGSVNREDEVKVLIDRMAVTCAEKVVCGPCEPRQAYCNTNNRKCAFRKIQ